MPFRRCQCQLHAHTARACPHVPQDIRRLHGQLCQCGGTHLLLGHRHLAPDEAFVREARRAEMRDIEVFHQKHAERCKTLPRQLCRRAVADGLFPGAKVFAHQCVHLAHAGIGQLPAEGGRCFGPAGEEKDGALCHALRHRVAGTAVGRHQLPVLPWAAQRRRQQLDAGNARIHPRRDAQRPQGREQAGRTGIKPGVPAVKHGGILPGSLRQRLKDLGRLIEGKLPGSAFGREARQQPLCAKHKARPAHSVLRLHRQSLPAAASHTDQCDHFKIS